MAARRGRGDGSIYQRKDGRWAATITLDNRKRKTFYGKTRKEVREKLRVAQHEQKQGILATGPHQKLGTYLTTWLETVLKPSARKTTYSQYRSMINHHLIPDLGHITVQKLTPQQVQQFQARKLEEGLAPGSVSVIRAILHKALENAIVWGLVSRNVVKLVAPPRMERHEVRFLDIEQANTLLQAARGHHLETLILLAVTTGMRRGEMLALRWSDIDLERGTLSINRSVNYVPIYHFVESGPKTKSGRRQIMLPDVVIIALKEHHMLQDNAILKAGSKWQENNLVFPNTYGSYSYITWVSKSFNDLLKETELPRIRFHDLRHSAASILLAKGVNPKVVQELLGHSSIKITMDLYSHIMPSIQSTVRDLMNDAFKDKGDNPGSGLQTPKDE